LQSISIFLKKSLIINASGGAIGLEPSTEKSPLACPPGRKLCIFFLRFRKRKKEDVSIAQVQSREREREIQVNGMVNDSSFITSRSELT
jgi:hypothetical protein